MLVITAATMALVTSSMITASAKPHESPQLAKVRAVLTDMKLPAKQIDKIMHDPKLIRQIPVSESVEVTAGSTPASSLVVPSVVGSSCSGNSSWVQRTQYRNNTYGQHQGWTRLRTDYCWNGRSVTYAHSTRTHGTTAWGVLMRWKEWSEFSEGWYAYNSRTNGGVKTVAQGHWEICLKFCVDYDQVARTYVHYDGTYYTSGHNYG